MRDPAVRRAATQILGLLVDAEGKDLVAIVDHILARSQRRRGNCGTSESEVVARGIVGPGSESFQGSVKILKERTYVWRGEGREKGEWRAGNGSASEGLEKGDQIAAVGWRQCKAKRIPYETGFSVEASKTGWNIIRFKTGRNEPVLVRGG